MTVAPGQNRPSLADVDLNDAEPFVTGDPHLLWARLRAECPVHWNPVDQDGFWALTTYDDVLAAYRDEQTFSSAHGAIMGGSYRSRVDTATGRMLVCADPPRHAPMRRRMQQVFSTAMTDKVAEQVRISVRTALARIAADGGGDFATKVAVELPAGALMALLAIGHDDALELVRRTHDMIGFLDPAHHLGIEDDSVRLVSAQMEVFDFFLGLIDERRARPGADAVSILLATPPGEKRLDRESLLFNLMNLAVGGDETTPHSASAGLVALMDNPGQWDRLAADPGLVATGVDEVLRWTSTNAYVQRVTLAPVRIRDVEIPEGERVTLWSASANRDAAQFTEPDRLDLGRKPNHHIAFGSGIHRCIGAATARLELTALLDELRALPVRLVAAGPPERLRSNFMLGVKHLPVAVAAG
jgi:cytochrome P450